MYWYLGKPLTRYLLLLPNRSHVRVCGWVCHLVSLPTYPNSSGSAWTRTQGRGPPLTWSSPSWRRCALSSSKVLLIFPSWSLCACEIVSPVYGKLFIHVKILSIYKEELYTSLFRAYPFKTPCTLILKSSVCGANGGCIHTPVCPVCACVCMCIKSCTQMVMISYCWVL